jgi:hypothetical protein
MFVWATLLVLVLAVLASGPFHNTVPAAVEPFAQLAAVLSIFFLVCAMESGGRNKDSGG